MMSRLSSAMLAFMLVLLAGCSKVSDEALLLIKTGATVAKERAAAFELIKPALGSAEKTAAADADIAKWSTEHSKGLSAQALALANISKSLDIRRSLEPQTKAAISNAAETARLRAEVFELKAPAIAAKNAADEARVKEFIESHRVALAEQAELFMRINNAISPPKK